ncbi:MAG: hypothetical protein E7445_02360 [Ruminococcaceae bacterium]|nr:hypothetical protein [Oscillospiraceae bacterium]
MDKIIEIKINGSHLTRDSQTAGVQHEGNAAVLRMEFDPGWDGFAKTVTFRNALGENPVKRILTADLLEDITKSTRVYLCPIPPEAMTEAGKLSYIVDGMADGVRRRSVEDRLKVLPAFDAPEAVESADPTPTQAEQLQGQVDAMVEKLQEGIAASGLAVVSAGAAADSERNAEISARAAAASARTAAASQQLAEDARSAAVAAVGKTSYIGGNGHWFEWDSTAGTFVDSGVAATGPAGADGRDGIDGAKGDKGDPGEPGEKGERGEKGDPGADGAKGDKGEKGDTGEKGDDGKSPYISFDGKWHEWDSAQGAFVDTGVTAKGEKGDSGLTPQIINNNWWVGGVDTGVRAKGQDGETPWLLEAGGNWLIGGVDTGFPSRGEKGDPGEKGDKGDAGAKGDKGEPGADGYTPVKGTDYWTAADRAEMAQDAYDELVRQTEWQATKSVLSGGDEVVPETRLSFTTSFTVIQNFAESLMTGLNYIVDWSGTEYTCMGHSGDGGVYIGNGDLVGESLGNDEPFCIQWYSGTDYINIHKKTSTAETITLSVIKDAVFKYNLLPTDFLPMQEIINTVKEEVEPGTGGSADCGGVKTVNGKAPDASGNVEIEVGTGGGGVSSWNDLTDKPFYEEPGLVELLPETEATGTTDPTFGQVWQITAAPALLIGETYTVVYNGAFYQCVGMPAPEGFTTDEADVALGNFAVVGGTDTGEPFAMLVMPNLGNIMAIDLAESASVTIAIYQGGTAVHPLHPKYLPDGVPYIIEHERTPLLEERQLTISAGMFSISEGAPVLTVGKVYTIGWNGAEYLCTAVDLSALEAGVVGFGNLAAFDPSLPAAGVPFWGFAAGGQLQIVPLDGSEELTLAIWQGVEAFRKLDGRCLDLSAVFANMVLNIKDGSANGSIVTGKPRTEDDEYTIGIFAFAQGCNTMASGSCSHAEGSETSASGDDSHAEGRRSKATGKSSHAEGFATEASGEASHSEGYDTTASGYASHAEGNSTASGDYSHSEGYRTIAAGEYQHVQGRYSIEDTEGKYAHIVGNGTFVNNLILSNAHTLDWDGNAWFAGDVYVGGTGQDDPNAKKLSGKSGTGEASHVEGSGTAADGDYSHAEGLNSVARGQAAHAEGYACAANAEASHAEGQGTHAEAVYSHAEGYYTTANGRCAHTEGEYTSARNYSHAEGYGTSARSDYQHVQGKYNVLDSSGKYAHIVGNGDNITRSNAHTLDWDGNAWFAGGIELTSPNGTRYRFTVSDDGTLTAAAVTE